MCLYKMTLRVGSFFTPGLQFKQYIGKNLLDEATKYQRPGPSAFRQEVYYSLFSFYVKQVNTRVGLFFYLGAII